MEITITLKHGPLDAEFEGEDREEIQQELLDFMEFLEEKQDSFANLSGSYSETGDNENESVQTPATEWEEGTGQTPSNSLLASVAERTRINEDVLSEVVSIPEDEEEPPHVRTYQFEQGAKVLGSSRNGRQARASLILLYLWKEGRGVDEVESSDLNDALSYSDVSPERRDAMYNALEGDADNYFNRNGQITLTPPGEHAAREEIRALAEEFETE